MKCKIGAYLLMLAGIMTLFSACGGDGGGSGPTPITVTVVNGKNPTLVNYSTTVLANFANYTSTVKFGSTVNFTVAPPATFSHVSSITTRAVKTQAGGLAWVTVKSPLPGTFTVSASSGNFAGSTAVSFINQPATVRVLAGLNKPITGLGGLSFNVISDVPAPTFINFSSSIKGANVDVQTTPLPPAAGIDTTSVVLVSASGVNVNPGELFRLDYLVVDKGVPILTLADLSAYLAGVNATPVTPDMFFTVSYYDTVGTKLYP